MDLALFDFDGTVTFKDSFSGFMHFAIPKHRKLAFGFPLLTAQCSYKLGLVSPADGRKKALFYGLKNISSHKIELLGEVYAAQILPDILRPRALNQIRWHQKRGDKVVLVSASLSCYLAPWCKHMGLDLICAELETVNGRLTGLHKGHDCYGEEKVRRIKSSFNLADFGQIYAYGDSQEDYEMLSLAHKAYYQWKLIDMETIKAAE